MSDTYGNDFKHRNYTVGYCNRDGVNKDKNKKPYEGYILVDDKPKYMFYKSPKGLKIFNLEGHEKSAVKKLPKELISMIYFNYTPKEV